MAEAGLTARPASYFILTASRTRANVWSGLKLVIRKEHRSRKRA